MSMYIMSSTHTTQLSTEQRHGDEATPPQTGAKDLTATSGDCLRSLSGGPSGKGMLGCGVVTVVTGGWVPMVTVCGSGILCTIGNRMQIHSTVNRDR